MALKKQAVKKTVKAKGDADATTMGVAAGALLVIFAVLYMVWPSSNAQTAEYESYLQSIGVRHSKVDIKCNGTGQDRWCALVAKRNLQQGDKVLHVPTSTVIGTQSILADGELGTALQVQQGSKLGELLQTRGMGHVYPTFLLAFKIWHEMKKSDMRISSPLHAWVDVVSKSSELRHVAYWTEEEAACLDPFTAMERNTTFQYVTQFTELAGFVCEENPSLASCAGFDAERAFKEMQWAFATLRQRTWGELNNPMLVPLVDFSFPHPTLCAPASEGGDGDIHCAGREARTALQPQQDESGEAINWVTSQAIPKGGYVFSAHRPLPTWETLGIYGYVDYANAVLPDRDFTSRLMSWARKTQTSLEQLAEDHPLRGCHRDAVVGWANNGQAKKELKTCWAAYFYVTLIPEAAVWDEKAGREYRKWKKNKKEQAKSAYLVQRALLRAAGGVQQFFQQNDQPAHCEAEDRTENAARAFKVRGLILDTLGNAMKAADKAQVEKFDSWAKLDPSADRDVSDTPPEPAPVADDEPADDEAGDLEDADPTQAEQK